MMQLVGLILLGIVIGVALVQMDRATHKAAPPCPIQHDMFEGYDWSTHDWDAHADALARIREIAGRK